MDTKLTPIRFPTNLLTELDKYIGNGNRSKFIIDATRKELHRLKQRKVIRNVAGIFDEKDYPELKTSEDASNWVRKIREEAVDHSLTLVTKNVRHFPMKELNIIEH